jgi:hypothetical protein
MAQNAHAQAPKSGREIEGPWKGRRMHLFLSWRIRSAGGARLPEYFPLKTNKNAPMGDIHTGLEILRLTALH